MYTDARSGIRGYAAFSAWPITPYRRAKRADKFLVCIPENFGDFSGLIITKNLILLNLTKIRSNLVKFT